MKTLSKFALALALALAGTAIGAKPVKHALPVKKPMQTAGGAKLDVIFPPISPNAPPDIPVAGGAGGATIFDAATFAWQEFIALNWPAATQNGQPNTRGVPDNSAKFGSDAQGQPLVWETLRSKVETFPGVGSPPGYPATAGTVPDYGFDNPPVYTYGTRATDGSGNQTNTGGTPLSVNPCTNQAPVSQPAWVNLDEVDQIGEDSMYAGVLPVAASPVNAQPQLIRFLAKGNRTFYDYVAQNQYWYHGAGYNAAKASFATAASNNAYPPPAPVIKLPAGTILVKAAWRELAQSEHASDFHTQTVRYYETTGSGQCYREKTWALIALHIIQKTPTAPYFIFATFEYTGNIVNAAGAPVEDINGGPTSTPTQPYPTTPPVSYWDADGLYYDYMSPKGTNSVAPPAGQPLPVAQVPRNSYCLVGTAAAGNQRLYYINDQFGDPASQQLPASGSANQGICVNKRIFPIPQYIHDVNAAAHSALASYGAPSRWQNYKLVSVQWQPFNQSEIDTSGGNYSRLQLTYYLANSVVETDNTLQQFFGGLTGTGLKSNYTGDASSPRNYNIYLPPTGGVPSNQFTRIDMGGCMGCHGRAQFVGDDFSFTLRGGPVKSPETPDAQDATRIQIIRAALMGHIK